MKKLVLCPVFIFFSCAALLAQQDDNITKARKQAAHPIAIITMLSRQGTGRTATSMRPYDNYSQNYTSSESPAINALRDINQGYNRSYNPMYPTPNGGTTFINRTSPFENAVLTLKDCQKLDPASIIYPFELGFAYYVDGRYKKSIKYLERLQYHKDVTAGVFQLLAKCYLLNKDEKNSFKAIERGLELFPDAGNLYQEAGFNCLAKKDSAAALKWFVKGINSNPGYASCYYQAFQIELQKAAYDKCQVLGEMFLNLESSGPRYREISRKMFRVMAVLFRFPESIPANEQAESEAGGGPEVLGKFTNYLIANGVTKKQFMANDSLGNELQRFKETVASNGHLEAYLYWLCQFGDTSGFMTWYSSNHDKWHAFAKWFKEEGYGMRFRR